MGKPAEFIRPTAIKMMPIMALIIFNFFWTWIVKWIPPDYLWRSLAMHIPIAYLLACLFTWFSQPEEKHLLMLCGSFAFIFSAISSVSNLLFYKGMEQAYPSLSISEIKPDILSFNLIWNAGFFVFLFFLCSASMWIYFYKKNKKRSGKFKNSLEAA